MAGGGVREVIARLVAGLLNGVGQVEMDPQKNLSGRVQIEPRARTVQALDARGAKDPLLRDHVQDHHLGDDEACASIYKLRGHHRNHYDILAACLGQAPGGPLARQAKAFQARRCRSGGHIEGGEGYAEWRGISLTVPCENKIGIRRIYLHYCHWAHKRGTGYPLVGAEAGLPLCRQAEQQQ